MLNDIRSPVWRSPSSFRGVFEQDAKYYGPWLPEEEVGPDGKRAWRLNRYNGRDGVDWSLRLNFINAKVVQLAAKCVFELEDDVLKGLVQVVIR
jgi:hypothetical protein